MRGVTIFLISVLLNRLYLVHGLTFKVNSASQLRDTIPGDGICRTSTGSCSLRAAVDESNARPTRDVIIVAKGIFPTHGTGGVAGMPIREQVVIRGKGATQTTLDGGKKERHFDIRNEKLIFGLRDGAVGAIRPSSGRRLKGITPTGDVSSSVGAFHFRSDLMYTTYFTKGVARYKLRSRETIEGSANKFPFAFDRIVISSDTGNGAGLTTPTTVSSTISGDILVNSFQPTKFGIRRYDGNSFAYKGIFINPPGIVNSLLRIGSRLYLTLVSDDEVREYDASTGAFKKSSSSFLRTPRGLATCDGRLFVASEDTNSIVEFDLDLSFVRSLTDTVLEEPQGVACISGDLFVKSKGSKLQHFRLRESGVFGLDFVRDLSGVGTFIAGIASMSGTDHVDGPKVNIVSLTTRNGRVRVGENGPSISVDRGCVVKIDKAVIRDNIGSVFGGAITNSGRTLIQNSRLVKNSGPLSTLSGGGVTNSGGAVGNFGKMTIRWTELSENQAARGGAIWSSGSEGFLVIFQCTISKNFAGNAGGGIYNTRYAQVKYSTITQNRCGQFSGDPASRRAGCGFYSFRNPTKVRNNFLLSHSIVAGNIQVNTVGNFAPDCLAEVTQSVVSAGGNLIGVVDSDVCKIIGRSSFDRRGERFDELDPMLGSLKFLQVKSGRKRKNSFTRGHNPLKGGPASTFNPYQNGAEPNDACPGKDQIGRARPQGGICDTGAIERGK